MDELSWDVAECARVSHIGENRLRELASAGEIPHIKVGKNKLVIVKAPFIEWLNTIAREQRSI